MLERVREPLPVGALSREVAAQYIGVSPRQLDGLASAGEIPRTKIGRRSVFQVKLLDAFLDRHTEMSGEDIEACYPMWHQLVRGMQEEFDRQGQPLNAEIYCLNLLITAIVTPRVYRNSVQRKAATETVVGLFREEHQRRLASEQLLSPPSSG